MPGRRGMIPGVSSSVLADVDATAVRAPQGVALALACTGAVVLRGALDVDAVGRLATAAERCYGGLSATDGPQVALLRGFFVGSASSFPLEVLEAAADMNVVRWLSDVEPIRRPVQAALGGGVRVARAHCWLRRQYAPARYPPGHAPHSWHQDGALGFDFAASGGGANEGLLAMLTCWCPLVPCGADAPGLELLTRPLAGVVPLAGLADASVRGRHEASCFVTPRLVPGDVLLLSGGVLHRTHVHSRMTRDRTSIEVRYFRDEPALARLGPAAGLVAPWPYGG